MSCSNKMNTNKLGTQSLAFMGVANITVMVNEFILIIISSVLVIQN